MARKHTYSWSLALRLASFLTIILLGNFRAASAEENFIGTTAPLTQTDKPDSTADRLTETTNASVVDARECLESNSTLNITVGQTPVSLVSTDNVDISGVGVCVITASTSPEHVLQVHFLQQTCTAENSVLVYEDGNTVTEDWDGCETVFDPLSDFTSSGGTVNIRIKLGDVSRPYALRMTVTAVATPVKPEIEVRFVSPTKGYIQTPGWNPEDYRSFPTRMDSWVNITVPQDHAVMISFYFLQLNYNFYSGCGDQVEIFTGGNFTEDDLVWRVCGTLPPFPLVLETDALHVHLTSDRVLDKWLGFRLLFSFHQISAAPERLASGKWNCSVPHWPDFDLHFLCNLEKECEAGEDEAACPYTDTACGHGRISAGGGCYVLEHPAEPITWIEASMECVSLGGHLASLNSEEEWRGFDEVIMNRKRGAVLTGLRTTSSKLLHMYKYAVQWADKTMAYLSRYGFYKDPPACSYTSMIAAMEAARPATFSCNMKYNMYYLCEVGRSGPGGSDDKPAVDQSEIRLAGPLTRNIGVHSVECPAGHVTHTFLACDARTACWAELDSTADVWGVPSFSACPAPLTSLPPSFTCANDGGRVPYSLVCDHRQDCQDASDEELCVFPTCTGSTPLQCGKTAQCVSQAQWCDGQPHCVDGSDEVHCDRWDLQYDVHNPPPPAVVDFDGRGSFTVTPLTDVPDNGSFPCPETHFQCPGDGYCLPVYVRCNGVYDCPGREDEAACSSYECPGFYRCRGSSVCLHPSHVCDGFYQCPGQDDELVCGVECPENCTCHGLAFFCADRFDVGLYEELRYLDASGTGMDLGELGQNNSMLIHVSLARCGLKRLTTITLPNLHSLDLSDNDLQFVSLEHITGMPSLRELSLSGNPLARIFIDATSAVSFPALKLLDLSGVRIDVLDSSVFTPFENLEIMNLSNSGVDNVLEAGFKMLGRLTELDLRGCPVAEFPKDVFGGLDRLQTVDSDNYKLCCPATLPVGFNLQNCRAPSDGISSCDALLGSTSYRVFTAVGASLALTGNLGSFVLRVLVRRSGLATTYGVFVTHLSVSDFLMGVYLTIIGVADSMYKGSYLWEDTIWRSSAACQVAGFFFMLSNEVSLFLIALITLDRVLVLHAPNYSRLHFHKMSAQVTCALVWILGLLLAVVPLAVTSWEVYGQTGICVPLPFPRNDFAGEGYAFGVVVVFTFILSVLITVGQAFVNASIRKSNVIATEKSKLDLQRDIARRLVPVTMVDCLCWFAVSLFGILASSGTPIPVEVGADMAVFILPLHSAINPILYMFGVLMERRQKAWEERLMKLVAAKVKASEAKAKVSRGLSSRSTTSRKTDG